ncbi:MAG: response regulator, partial [Clostridia bacterium]|nr:response regulator [Clostridia bacterium]
MEDTRALTILIVDDSATDRAIIRGMLGEYKTISAADGREAMDILERQPDVDLVILDLN